MNDKELAKNVLNRKPATSKQTGDEAPAQPLNKGVEDYIAHMEVAMQNASQMADMLQNKIQLLDNEIREKNSVIISQAMDLEANRRTIAFQHDALSRIEVMTNSSSEDFPKSANGLSAIISRIHLLLVGR